MNDYLKSLLDKQDDDTEEQSDDQEGLLSKAISKAKDVGGQIAEAAKPVTESVSQGLEAINETVDPYTGLPARAAALAALSGQNPIMAAYNALGSKQQISGQDVVKKAYQDVEQLTGTNLKDEQGNYPYQKYLGAAAEFGLDPTWFLPAAKAGKLGELLKLTEKGSDLADVARLASTPDDISAISKVVKEAEPVSRTESAIKAYNEQLTPLAGREQRAAIEAEKEAATHLNAAKKLEQNPQETLDALMGNQAIKDYINTQSPEKVSELINKLKNPLKIADTLKRKANQKLQQSIASRMNAKKLQGQESE